MSSTLRSLFSPSDENIQLETLGEEFDLAGMSEGEDTPYFEFWTLRCIGIVRTMIRFAHLICLKSLRDEMFRSCEDNTYIIIIIIVVYRSDI